MTRFIEALGFLGVLIIAGLIYAVRCDRRDSLEIHVAAPDAVRIHRIGTVCLWVMAIGFSLLCCFYIAWLYQRIPDTWEWRLR